MGVLIVVETLRESDGALLVATARGGSGVDPSSPSPFAFERAADGRFIACLRDGSGDGGEGIAASRSAVTVVVARASVHVRWVGALEAVVFRHGEVVHRTAPHFLGPELAASGPGREAGIDLAGPWPTEPGDLVLLCSAKVRRVLSEADVAALANRDDIAAIVRGLVTTASTRGDFVDLCAMAIRIVVP